MRAQYKLVLFTAISVCGPLATIAYSGAFILLWVVLPVYSSFFFEALFSGLVSLLLPVNVCQAFSQTLGLHACTTYPSPHNSLHLQCSAAEFLLDSIEDVVYLSDKEASRVDGVDDVADFQSTVRAMDVVGITEAERRCVWRTLSAIMKLGQMKFSQDRTDQATMPDDTKAAMVCKLLGMPLADFVKAMLKPRIKVRLSLSLCVCACRNVSLGVSGCVCVRARVQISRTLPLCSHAHALNAPHICAPDCIFAAFQHTLLRGLIDTHPLLILDSFLHRWVATT